MKFYLQIQLSRCLIVLPLTREWIEIYHGFALAYKFPVLPLTREWIEMALIRHSQTRKRFSLLRGSGLKSDLVIAVVEAVAVLPLTREWIEITQALK